jgi:hypothetical protein
MSKSTAAMLASVAARNKKSQEQVQAAARQADQATGPYTPAPGEAAESASNDVDTPHASGVDHPAAADMQLQVALIAMWNSLDLSGPAITIRITAVDSVDWQAQKHSSRPKAAV